MHAVQSLHYTLCVVRIPILINHHADATQLEKGRQILLWAGRQKPSSSIIFPFAKVVIDTLLHKQIYMENGQGVPHALSPASRLLTTKPSVYSISLL